jgi:predicted nucleotidyltransferase component of viral defense system
MNSYYSDTLYPLQDKVLKIVDLLKTPFYLTGGTALSRCYLNHRYSDDLDFFVNNETNFLSLVDTILRELQQNFAVETVMRSETYVAIKIETILKVDFVNDVAFRYGDPKPHPLFSRIDNLENILSNKLSALISRDEAKDVVDIVAISKKIVVDWRKIFLDVNSKAVGISPVDVAKRLTEFPLELLDVIKWIEGREPRVDVFQTDISQMCDSMLRVSPITI